MAIKKKKADKGTKVGKGRPSMGDDVRRSAIDAENFGVCFNLPDNMGVMKMKKGQNEIVILPWMVTRKTIENRKPGTPWYRLSFLKHNNLGVENKGYVCPRSIGKPCPACELRESLIEEGADKDDAEPKALAAKKRDAFVVLDPNDDGETDFKLWEVSYYMFTKLLEEEIRTDDEDGIKRYFADPGKMQMLTVRMKEKSFPGSARPALEANRIDFDELDEQIDDDLLDAVPSLDELLIVPSYDDLKAIVFDRDEGDGEEEEEETRKPSKKKAGIKPKKKVEEEEEEMEEEEEEEEEQEERKPSKKTATKPAAKKPGRKSEPEPEEEEEEEEEEDEEEESEGDYECPNDGTFGQTCDDVEGCEDCEFWTECRDATDDFIAEQEAAVAQKTKKAGKVGKPAAKKPGRKSEPEPEEEEEEEEERKPSKKTATKPAAKKKILTKPKKR